MPTSFEAMHEETRPLALLDERAARRPWTGGIAACCISTVILVLPLLL